MRTDEDVAEDVGVTLRKKNLQETRDEFPRGSYRSRRAGSARRLSLGVRKRKRGNLARSPAELNS